MNSKVLQTAEVLRSIYNVQARSHYLTRNIDKAARFVRSFSNFQQSVALPCAVASEVTQSAAIDSSAAQQRPALKSRPRTGSGGKLNIIEPSERGATHAIPETKVSPQLVRRSKHLSEGWQRALRSCRGLVYRFLLPTIVTPRDRADKSSASHAS